MTDIKRESEPHGRLTYLADQMLAELDHEGTSDVKAVVMLHDEETGGLALKGYEDDQEAIDDIFQHLRILLRTSGRDLAVFEMGEGPSEN